MREIWCHFYSAVPAIRPATLVNIMCTIFHQHTNLELLQNAHPEMPLDVIFQGKVESTKYTQNFTRRTSTGLTPTTSA